MIVGVIIMSDIGTSKKYEAAIFAGGCFWCMVSPFDVLEGITEVKWDIQEDIRKIQHIRM